MKSFCLGNNSSSIQALIYAVCVSSIKLEADVEGTMIDLRQLSYKRKIKHHHLPLQCPLLTKLGLAPGEYPRTCSSIRRQAKKDAFVAKKPQWHLAHEVLGAAFTGAHTPLKGFYEEQDRMPLESFEQNWHDRSTRGWCIVSMVLLFMNWWCDRRWRAGFWGKKRI